MTIATEELPDTEESTEVETPPDPPPASPRQALAGAVATISPMDLEFVKRRPAVQAALASVTACKSDLSAAMVIEVDAKKAVKGKEAALEAAWERLAEVLDPQEAPVSPTPLFDNAASATSVATAPTTEDVQAWEARWRAFLAQPIDVLNVADGVKDKLREHKPEAVATLQNLVDIKTNEPVRGYQSIAGIGEAKADALDDAFEALQLAFLTEHPNPTPAAEKPDPGAIVSDYDFDTTFPTPVNPTPHEEYDADYHTAVITDSVTELTELRETKTALAGDGLADKKRKKLETHLAELQMQYDEGFDQYAEKFGKQAAERLRKLVEARVDKQASLKGGLE